MLHVVLFQPEIPQNTGNIGRTCAITESRLHLIYPLGFEIRDKHLKRSGMDYWHNLDIRHHENWEAFKASSDGPDRLFLMTTKGSHSYWDMEYKDGDGLLFGREGSGAPDWLHDEIGEDNRILVPIYNDTLRSLNLATSAGIAIYEVMRQLKG
ncbi:MAG: tRNA (cytidine(34)-2'-O)-methyltransferase [Opitutaceae bacterium]|nr:tRNA (cytidine(34)-2'-O)-methyltransferase [Opitutaceae bacterium]